MAKKMITRRGKSYNLTGPLPRNLFAIGGEMDSKQTGLTTDLQKKVVDVSGVKSLNTVNLPSFVNQPTKSQNDIQKVFNQNYGAVNPAFLTGNSEQSPLQTALNGGLQIAGGSKDILGAIKPMRAFNAPTALGSPIVHNGGAVITSVPAHIVGTPTINIGGVGKLGLRSITANMPTTLSTAPEASGAVTTASETGSSFAANAVPILNIATGLATMGMAGYNNTQIRDTSNVKKYVSANSQNPFTASNNEGLIEQYNAYTPVKLLHVKDVRNSVGSSLTNTATSGIGGALAGAGAGALAGSSGGPYGAIIGAAAGLTSGIATWIAGNAKARSKTSQLNNYIRSVNARNLQGIGEMSNYVDRLNDQRIAMNYAAYGGDLNTLGNGGSIHINPANKGKLTATSRRTGKSFSELAHSSNPLTRKRAIFALNARKWNHKAYGGNLFADGGPIKNPYQTDSTYVVPSYNYIDNPLPLTYGNGGNGFLGGGAGGTWEEAMARHGLTEFGKPIPPERDFNQAYGEARKAKKKSFIFDGKEYTTKYSVNPWNNIIGSQRIENKRNSAGQPRKRKGNNSNVTATPSDITFGGGGEGFKGGGAGASFINNKQYSYGGLIDENNNNQLDASMLLSNPALQPYLYSKEELLNGVNSNNTPQEENNNYQNQLLNINPTREVQPAVMPITTQIPYAPVKSQLTTILNPKEYVTRTPLPVYNNSKYSASKQIRNMIAKWEGSSMKTNVPIDTKFRELMNIIPRDSINRLSPYQLDALGSYYYNVKPQSFTRTVGGALQKLGRAQDINEYNNILAEIAKGINIGMGNRKLPGLKTRRLAEQNIFLNGYNHFAEGGPIKHNKTTLKESIIPLFPQLFSKKDVDNLKKLHPEYFYLPQKDKLTNDQQILSIFKGNRNPSGALKAYIPDEKNIDVTDQSYIPDNRYALGGTLKENSQFSNGVTDYNSGGTHEENPNTGVQIGEDNQGTPNMVEEGEVRYKDYIFSNRLAPNRQILADNLLPMGLSGHSYAEIADRLSKESKERPNDPISKNGLESAMQRLRMAQEISKAAQEQEQQRIAALQQMQQGQQNPQDAYNMLPSPDEQQQGNNPEEQDEQDMQGDGTQQYAYGGNLFADGGDYTNPPGGIIPYNIDNLVASLPSDLNDNESVWSHDYLMSKLRQPNRTLKYVGNGKYDIGYQDKDFFTKFVSKGALNKRNAAYNEALKEAASLYYNGKITRGSYYQLTSRLVSKYKNFYNENASRHLLLNPSMKSSFDRTKPLDLTGQEIKEINQELRFAKENPESQLGYQGRNSIVRDENGFAVTDSNTLKYPTPINKTRIKNTPDVAFHDYITDVEKSKFFTNPNNLSISSSNNDNYKVTAEQVKEYRAKAAQSKNGVYTPDNVHFWFDKAKREQYRQSQESSASGMAVGGYSGRTSRGSSRTSADYTLMKPQAPPRDKVGSTQSIESLFPINKLSASNSLLSDDYVNQRRQALIQANENEKTRQWLAQHPYKKKFPWGDALSYVPALGASIASIGSMFGDGKPDNRYADLVFNASRGIPNARAQMLGNYETYRPFDEMYYQNQAKMAYNAATSKIDDTASGNQAVANAQRLANNYNLYSALGATQLQGENANIARKDEVSQFNRATDQYNSQAALEADKINSNNYDIRLRGIMQAANMMNADANTYNEMKMANLGNMFTSIGNIGREMQNKDQMRMIAATGGYGSIPADFLDRLGFSEREKFIINRQQGMNTEEALNAASGRGYAEPIYNNYPYALMDLYNTGNKTNSSAFGGKLRIKKTRTKHPYNSPFGSFTKLK